MEKCFNFAMSMTSDGDGEHRDHRSGGDISWKGDTDYEKLDGRCFHLYITGLYLGVVSLFLS